jgi:hypothetical protein
MDTEDIQRRIDELDAAVSREGAQLLIFCEGGENQDCELIGNRQGYLRAGVELLRAAVAPLRPGDSITSINIDYLVANERSLRVKRLTRQEDVDAALPPLRKNTWKDKAIGIGCLVMLAFLAFCSLIGIGMIGKQIFGK